AARASYRCAPCCAITRRQEVLCPCASCTPCAPSPTSSTRKSYRACATTLRWTSASRLLTDGRQVGPVTRAGSMRRCSTKSPFPRASDRSSTSAARPALSRPPRANLSSWGTTRRRSERSDLGLQELGRQEAEAMEALDGNAIAGTLHAAFGDDMTTARSTCATCGNAHELAALRVYLRAPGAVARCPSCDAVRLVLI